MSKLIYETDLEQYLVYGKHSIVLAMTTTMMMMLISSKEKNTKFKWIWEMPNLQS